jgi:hypothetical protein
MSKDIQKIAQQMQVTGVPQACPDLSRSQNLRLQGSFLRYWNAGSVIYMRFCKYGPLKTMQEQL